MVQSITLFISMVNTSSLSINIATSSCPMETVGWLNHCQGLCYPSDTYAPVSERSNPHHLGLRSMPDALAEMNRLVVLAGGRSYLGPGLGQQVKAHLATLCL